MIDARRLLCLTASLFAFLSLPAGASGRIKLYTSSDSPVQADVVGDIERLIAKPNKISLDVRPTSGPAESLERMHQETASSLAILPSDTAYAYAIATGNGFPDANQLFSPVRVIGTLFPEEILLIVRKDSPFNAVHDIRNARINVGPKRSRSALTAGTMYHLMFGEPIAEKDLFNLSHENALIDLVSSKNIDVVVAVGAQPMKLLADMRADAREHIRLLSFDATHPVAARLLEVYASRAIPSTTYPNLLDEDLSSVGLSSQLVAYRPRLGRPEPTLKTIARSWCAGAERLSALTARRTPTARIAEASAANDTHQAPVLAEVARCPQ